MAVESEQLVVQLEARIRDFEKNFQKANKTANDNFRQIERRGQTAASRLEKSMASAGSRMANSMRTWGAGIAGVLGARSITAASAQYVNLQNTLKVTGIEGKELESVFSQLFQVAQKNGTPIEALATLYSRASQAQGELKASSAELMRFTDGVSLALRVAGTDSQQASGALLQLSQALGSGTVRAEEFNSVNEGARPILQAVAAGMKEAGGSVATLKNLVNEGKVSSEAFFRAFLAGMPTLETAASKAQGTVGQAMARIQNAFVVFVGELDKASGASLTAAENLDKVARVIEGLPGYIHAAAGGFDKLQDWLTKLGNHPFWTRLAKLAGVKFTAEEALAAGIVLPEESKPENVPLPLSRPKNVTPISLNSYAVKGKDKAAGSTEEEIRADQVERYIEALQRSSRVLQAELNTIGKSNAERAKAIELARIGTVTDAGQLQKIEETVGANEALRQKIEQVTKATESLKEAGSAAGHALTDALGDVLIDGADADEVIANLSRQFARLALQAALMGSGPLGGLSGGSGFLGALFGGARASGGPIDPGRVYLTGERGPELIVPRSPGTVIPNAALGLGGSSVQQNQFNVTVNGSSGTPAQNQDLAERIGRQLEDTVRGLVGRELRTQIRPGGLLNRMR